MNIVISINWYRRKQDQRSVVIAKCQHETIYQATGHETAMWPSDVELQWKQEESKSFDLSSKCKDLCLQY